jgi:ABC-type dipeptide/oligopeptide/nickel transport system permease component
MFSAAPWTAFLALLALEVVVIVAFRLGVVAVSTLVHRHEAMPTTLD